MQLSKIAFAIVLGVSVSAYAEESVMVDLSVLDSLTDTYTVSSEPLFPVLPKKTKSVFVKQAPKVKSMAKKAIAKKEKVEPLIIKDARVEKEPLEPVVVVDVEPVTASDTKVLISNSLAHKEKVDVLPQALTTSEEKTVETSITDIAVNTEAKTLSDTKLIEAEVQNETPVSVEDKPQLLINETQSVSSETSTDRYIVFAEGVDELNSEQMAKIDEIIGRFKDINTNKIAIYSYNLDDGIDSFKKKRISLNRAVEVRSYLLKQGYKNFSIKVININSESDKINMVELEEI